MKLIADPTDGMPFRIALAADGAMGGQIRQHLRQRHRALTFQALGFLLDDLALPGPAALALRLLRWDECHRFLARLDGGGIARNVADNALLMRSFDQRLVHS